LHGDVAGAIDHFWQDTESRWKLLRGDKLRPLLPPHELFIAPDAFNAMLKPFARVALDVLSAQAAEGVTAPVRRLPPLQVDRRADDPLAALKRAIGMFDGRMLIVAESAGRRETMQQYFAEYGLRPALVDDFAAFVAGDAKLALGVSPLAAGFVWPRAK